VKKKSQTTIEYAEDLNYWQTSRSSPDDWIVRAKILITEIGGIVEVEAFGSELETARSAFMLGFRVGGDRFKVIWPVLKSKSGNLRAAKVQAATLLYHDVKAKCMTAKVFGARQAFFQFWLLPDGQRAVDLSPSELKEAIPQLFLSPPIEGEIVP
jgi:hypothetical protein